MGQDCGSGPQHVQGERPPGLDARMVTGGNEEDGNPEGGWAGHPGQREPAGGAVMLQSAGRRLRLDTCCCANGKVGKELDRDRNPSHQDSSWVLVCTGLSLELLCSSERRTSLEVWENQPDPCWSLQWKRGAEKGPSPALKVLVLLTGKAVCGQPPGAVQPGQQTHGGREGPRVRVLVLVCEDSRGWRWWRWEGRWLR